MWARRFCTPGVQTQRMVRDSESLGLGDGLLAVFDLGIVKLFDLAAVKANEVIMVLAFVELVHRLAALKLAATQNTGLFELR